MKSTNVNRIVLGGLIIMGLFASLMAACQRSPKKPKPEKISAEEVREFTALHLSESGMSRESCYGYFVDETEEGWQLRITCAMWDQDEEYLRPLTKEELSRVRELVQECGVEKWNGFDKSDPNVLDGNSFSLTMALKNGKQLDAKGYCNTPENYQTFRKGLNGLFAGDLKRYSYDRIPKTLESDDLNLFYMHLVGKGGLQSEDLKIELRSLDETDQNSVWITVSSVSGELSGGVPGKANFSGNITNIDLSAFQKIIRKYDLPKLNGYDENSSGEGEYFSFTFGYSDGESVAFSGNVAPEHYEEFRKEFMELGFAFIEQYRGQLKEC